MTYDIARIDLKSLFGPACRAVDALSRLDECVARSPIRTGFLQRQDFAEAIASMWVDGELVHVEDLVLHDARRDARTPTHELTIAHALLRMRRQIFEHPADWALSASGIARLRGRAPDEAIPQSPPSQVLPDASSVNEDDPSVDEFAAIDAVLARSTALLDQAAKPTAPRSSQERDPLLYEADWDEDERLAEWLEVMRLTQDMPPIIRGVILLDSWHKLQVLQHKTELGRQLVASFLRREWVTKAHLPALSTGLKSVKIDRRRSPSRMTRLLAILEGIEIAGISGIKEHDRLLAARDQLERKTTNRRGHSRLPQLVDLVISRPVVSTALIASELDMTPQGALILTKELNLREMTGRGRYRAWGII